MVESEKQGKPQEGQGSGSALEASRAAETGWDGLGEKAGWGMGMGDGRISMALPRPWAKRHRAPERHVAQRRRATGFLRGFNGFDWLRCQCLRSTVEPCPDPAKPHPPTSSCAERETEQYIVQDIVISTTVRSYSPSDAVRARLLPSCPVFIC